MNCWEFKQCNITKKSCPAYPDHGTHCAKIAGTLCSGTTQGTFASKLVNCMKCEFYKTEFYDKKWKV